MNEMSEEQIKKARQVSADFERFWRIFSFADGASIEEIRWADEFYKANSANFKALVGLGNLDEDEVMELVWLGLYHRGYKLPPELKFKRSWEN